MKQAIGEFTVGPNFPFVNKYICLVGLIKVSFVE